MKKQESYILRGQKTSNDRYTIIDNNIIQGGSLTHTEGWLLIYLLSLPAQWRVRKTEIEKRMVGMSRTQFRKAFQGLINLRHIQVEQLYVGNLKNGVKYYVFEKPIPDSPELDSPTDAHYKVHTQENTHKEIKELKSNSITTNSSSYRSSTEPDFTDPLLPEVDDLFNNFFSKRNL